MGLQFKSKPVIHWRLLAVPSTSTTTVTAKQHCTITSSSCAGTSVWQLPSTWYVMDESHKSSQLGVSFQSEVSEVHCVCCAQLSWWPAMPNSCLEQARLFGPAHPVTTNASYSGQVLLVTSICYQIGCYKLAYNCNHPFRGKPGTMTGLLKWIAC